MGDPNWGPPLNPSIAAVLHDAERRKLLGGLYAWSLFFCSKNKFKLLNVSYVFKKTLFFMCKKTLFFTHYFPCKKHCFLRVKNNVFIYIKLSFLCIQIIVYVCKNHCFECVIILLSSPFIIFGWPFYSCCNELKFYLLSFNYKRYFFMVTFFSFPWQYRLPKKVFRN